MAEVASDIQAHLLDVIYKTSGEVIESDKVLRVLALADKGWQRACSDNPHLAAGVNVHAGKIIHPAVAAALHSK